MDTREEVQTVELNQLRCFRLVAEMENISRAAKLLHISQPSLSQTIRRVEQEIGFPLFHREGKRIELNRAGQFLLDRIEKYYDHYSPISKNKGKVGLAKLGNDAGIYGAARLVLG